MKHHLAIIGAVLRKDLVLHWPLIAVTALLLQQPTLSLVPGLQIPAVLMTLQISAMYLACALLIVTVIQQDALPGLQHDWLTKPIPRMDLFLAKSALLVSALALPIACAELTMNLVRERSLGETLLAVGTVQQISPVVVFLAVAAVATFTTTLIEAALILAASLLAGSLLLIIAFNASGIGETGMLLSSGWVLLESAGFLAVAAVAAILWLQFGHRKTVASRIVFACVGMVLALSPAAFSWRSLFAVQQHFSERPQAADAIHASLMPACFPASAVDPTVAGISRYEGIDPELLITPARMRDELWPEWQRKAAGADAIAFATSATFSGVAEGQKLRIGRVEGHYLDVHDQVQRRIVPALFTPVWKVTPDGNATAGHLWLLPRATHDQLARDASTHLQVDYAVSLLESISTQSLTVDEERVYSSDLGYCGAQRDVATGVVFVDCLKSGAQPAQFVAEIEGLPKSSATSTLDYTPAWLEFLGAQRHLVVIGRAPASAGMRVKVTAYRDVAHFMRQVSVPGVLGGPTGNCPAPAPST